MSAINIILNGETREVPKEINLDHLLELFALPKQRIAIELNNQVIRRSAWPETVVATDGVCSLIVRSQVVISKER